MALFDNNPWLPPKVYPAASRSYAEEIEYQRARERDEMYAKMLALQQAQGLGGMQQAFLGSLLGGQGPAAPPVLAIDLKKLDALKNAQPRVVTQAMPDSIVPVVAWRAWRVTTKLNGQWTLKALGQDGLWEPKKMMEAKCSGGQDHPAPHRDCNCGIWSFRTLEELLPALKGYDNVKVLGQVSIWGRVLECENGFRSQFAYPKELWLLDETMEQIGYAYGVPIRTVK